MRKPIITLSEKVEMLYERLEDIETLQKFEFLTYVESRDFYNYFMPDTFQPSFVCFADFDCNVNIYNRKVLYRIYFDFEDGDFCLESEFMDYTQTGVIFDKEELLALKFEMLGYCLQQSIEEAKILKMLNKDSVDKTSLYLIHDTILNTLKIGRSKNVSSRIKTLQIATSNKLNVLFEINGLGHKEKEVHSIFKDFQLTSEWFKYDLQIIEHFNSLKGN